MKFFLKIFEYKTIFLAFAILIAANSFLDFDVYRFDLTKDKRYTLSETSKSILDSLPENVFCQFYLEGDNLPTDFKRLRDEAKRLFTEYNRYSKGKIKFLFVNPFQGKNSAKNQELTKKLEEAGIPKIDLTIKKEFSQFNTYALTGGFMRYKERQIVVPLFDNKFGLERTKAIESSIQNLEYLFTSSLYQLLTKEKPTIAFLSGHGELPDEKIIDISYGLAKYYKVKRLEIENEIERLDSISAIIIAKPLKQFSEKDKYVLDQYVMRGGKLLWFIDQSNPSVDSMKRRGYTLAYPLALNLEDMLFQYGVRFEHNLVADLTQSVSLPIITGQNNSSSNLVPWYFSPLATANDSFFVTKNVPLVRCEFAGTIFSVKNQLRKTPLLQSGEYTKIFNTSFVQQISLNTLLQKKQDLSTFANGIQNYALLVEGTFTSLFKGREKPNKNLKKHIQKEKTEGENAMVFVADGDLIANEYDLRNNQYFPLGYDKFLTQHYGNKAFIENIVNYLVSENSLLKIRGRAFELRPLDKVKIKSQKSRFQVINTVLPILLIIVLGIIKGIIRTYRYTSS